MNKSELLVALATLPDGDARLERLCAILQGKERERPESLRLLRMGEAAKVTGLSRCSLWRAIRENRLRAVEIRRGSQRIPEAELRRFVEGRA